MEDMAVHIVYVVTHQAELVGLPRVIASCGPMFARIGITQKENPKPLERRVTR